jgi:hypothetical protein
VASWVGICDVKIRSVAGGTMLKIHRLKIIGVSAITTATLMAGATLAVIPAVTAAAATAPAPPFGECPAIGASPSCEILLVVNPDNTVSVYGDPSVGPFDGSDDTLVGIVNDSTAAVKAVTVSGPGSDLSGFDGDGICSGDYGTWSGSSGCPYGPTGYEGLGTSFVTDPTLPDSAEVDFAGGLAPKASAYFSLEGALTSAELTAREGTLQESHYELDFKLWIPQKDAVDPANPLGKIGYPFWSGLVKLGYEPDLSNPSPSVGLFEPGSTCADPKGLRAELKTEVSSVLGGDGYAGFDGGSTFRVAAKVTFDWDGTSISNLAFSSQDGVSRRLISEHIGSSQTGSCVEDHAGTSTVSATTPTDSSLYINVSGVVGFLTGQAAELGTNPSNTWNVKIAPDGSLQISYSATEFPTTGLRVLVNGQAQATAIVNDASCYSQASLLGLGGIVKLTRLFHSKPSGQLPEISANGAPVNVDHPSPAC